MKRSRLILISGPIAAGKTMAAEALAGLARSRGIAAMAIDMDEVIAMVGGSDWSAISNEQRRIAGRLAGGLIGRAYSEGIDLVAVAGSTLSGYEWDEVTAGLPSDVRVTRVGLRVSVDESIRRAQLDPTRVATHEPSYVAQLAAAIDWASVPNPDMEVDTEGMTRREVVERIASYVGLPFVEGAGE